MNDMTKRAQQRATGAARPRYGSNGASFSERHAVGTAGEEAVAAWLRARGWTPVDLRKLPKLAGFHGPALMTPHGPIPTPDLLALRAGEAWLIEAKTKAAAGFSRRHSAWTTGVADVDLERCLRAAEATRTPVWLMFLHEPRDAAGGPAGLFGGDARDLAGRAHHRFGGMVYWRLDNLKRLATLDEVRAAQAATGAGGGA